MFDVCSSQINKGFKINKYIKYMTHKLKLSWMKKQLLEEIIKVSIHHLCLASIGDQRGHSCL